MRYRFSVLWFLVIVCAWAIVASGCRLLNPGGDGGSGGSAAPDTVLTGVVQADLPPLSVRAKSGEAGAIRAAIEPVPQAEVWLEDLPFFPHTFTDENGQYFFRGLPPGVHRVIASYTRGVQQYKQRSTQRPSPPRHRIPRT